MNSQSRDANDAGTNKSKDCTLYVTENPDHPEVLARAQSLDKDGILTVESFLTIQENAMMLKQYLGLRDNVDYTDSNELKTLRYGKVVFIKNTKPKIRKIRVLRNYLLFTAPNLFCINYVEEIDARKLP